MIYKFIDNLGTFRVDNPHQYKLYFPLTNAAGSIFCSISPNLAGDIKMDNGHFLTPPASIEDIRSNFLCRRDFFIKTGKQVLRLSYPYNDTLEAGFLYQKVIKNTGSFEIQVLNFVPYDLPVEVMWVKIKNTGRKELSFVPTSFIPLYGRAEKNLRDHRHVSSLLNRISLDRYGILLKPTMVFDEAGHKVNRAEYFVLGFQGNGRAPIGQFPTLDFFCGRGDLIFPEAVMGVIKPVKNKLGIFDGKEACAALRFSQRRLRQGEEADYFLVMGMQEDRQKIKKIFSKLNSAEKITDSFQATKKYWVNYLSRISFDFGDKDFNNWLLWVKLQPVLRKLFGCSFLPHFDYGKGGRGWRDLWQDALSLLLTEPDKAAELIRGSFRGVRIDGSNATIITKDGDFLSDRNSISRVWMDHGVWPYLTTRFCLNKAADLGLLLEEVTYFRDHQLKRCSQKDTCFKQEDYLLRDKNKKIYTGTVLEHILIQNLVQFFNVGSHNIIRLENADWNDGLDMAPERGESVAFSFMYAHNLNDFCAVLEKLKEKTPTVSILKELTLIFGSSARPIDYGKYKEKQNRLMEYLDKTAQISGEKVKIKIDVLIRDLKDKSGHLFSFLRKKEWLACGFFNGYYDNLGRPVEGACGGKTKMMLTSQVFAMMSGVAAQGQITKAWISIKKHLYDKKLGGFRLNTDFGAPYLELGRAFGFAYGEKENGAVFNHMVVMLANALYAQGFTAQGFTAINSVYKMATADNAQIGPMIPEYFNNEGRGLYHYLTGSASWYIYTLIEQVLGVRFIWGDILLEPKLIAANFIGHSDSIEAKFYLGKKSIRAVFRRKHKVKRMYNIKEVFLNNKIVQRSPCGYLLKKESLREENTIVVNLA